MMSKPLNVESKTETERQMYRKQERKVKKTGVSVQEI